jgi:protein-S-isoprenylcysteine O-methyltransferase Ste14
MIPDVLTLPFLMYIGKKKELPTESQVKLSKGATIFFIISKFIYFPAVILSFFLPLQLWKIWFYVGLPITLIGLVTSWMVLYDWNKAPQGKPVTRGLYRYSRHPMYVTWILFLVGVSIVTASLIFLLFPIVIAAGAAYFINMEEEQCLAHYGSAYRDYMKRTPRWIGIPKSEKKRI